MRQKFSFSTSYYRNIRGIGISSSSIELLLTESCPSSTPPAKVALILLFFDPRDESPMLTEVVWRKKEKPPEALVMMMAQFCGFFFLLQRILFSIGYNHSYTISYVCRTSSREMNFSPKKNLESCCCRDFISSVKEAKRGNCLFGRPSRILSPA